MSDQPPPDLEAAPASLSDPAPPGRLSYDLPMPRDTAAELPTRVHSRGQVLARIDRQLAVCRRFQQPLVVLSIAVDGIGISNGRPVPDRLAGVALEFGRRLRMRVRATDSVLWPGGREFVVLLADSHRDGLATVQGRLAAALGGPYRLGPDLLDVTLVLGSAWFPGHADSAAELLRLAESSRQPVPR